MSETAPPGPLAGVRVLEWAEGIPGPTASWLLAECGADVVKVELPSGDRYRSELGFHVLNRGKRAVVIDLEDERQRERFVRLASAAEVVIVDEIEGRLEKLGLGYDAGRFPSLLWCSLPMFGREGPRAGLPAEDALAEAASAISAMQWSYGKAPVCFVTPMVSYAAGFLAALGIAAALRTRAARGQRIDSSGLAAAMLLQSGTYVTGPGHEGSLAAQADDPRGVFPTYGLYRTSDGWIFVGALTEVFWTQLATLLGRTDLLADASLPQNPMAFGKPEVRQRLRRELEPVFAAAPTSEWLRRFDEADIPIGRVQSRREYLHEDLAAATAGVIEIEDPELGVIRQGGAPVIFDGEPPRSPLPAPRLDPDSEASFRPRAAAPYARRRAPSRPLEGLRVLDLTCFIAGPLCPMLLADLGADVVKIESPRGDPFRLATYGFEGWNRGKRSLVLDFGREAGRGAFLRLADRADVVVENFRGGVMERLGLGFGILAARNPKLVYTAITGFGSTGPDAARPGFDPVLQARSGLSQAQGGEDEPVLHQVAYTDYMSGTLAAFATAAALFERERTGRGRHVDVSLHRTAFAMQAGEIVECAGEMPEARGGRDLPGRSALHRSYAAKDGWLFIAAGDREQAAAVGRALGLSLDPGEMLRAALEGPVAKRIAAAVGGWEKERLVAELVREGAPAAPCVTFGEVFTDPHLRRNRLILDCEHPRLGRISEIGEILRFSVTPMAPPRPAPALGEHGREILAEAGFSPLEIEELVKAGVTLG